ncbi:DUF5988 family protein [Micromonospora olivasterospora]|uniref:Glyoxalase-like domain-containing protein n=1 Tax=Micromonospora olivasterospora TaxID=1880 RepID=A0A562IF49_MICOL|nr:DUF5988 family protein [Micromonospora olivasterospora]TWH69224.1 hypothetical protein JD77_04232 [Micromonospora olivasterospora]
MPVRSVIRAAISDRRVRVRHHGGYEHFERDPAGSAAGAPVVFRWTGPGHRLTVSEWYEDPEAVDPAEGPAVLTIHPADPQLLLSRALAAGAELEPAAGDTPAVVLRDPAGQRWAVVGATRSQ